MNKGIVLVSLLVLSLSSCTRKSSKIEETERKKRRQHRQEWRTTQWNKTFKNMNFDELEIRKNELLESKDFYTATKYIQQMISLGPDLKKLSTLILELGDAQFEQGNLSQAEENYKEFTQMYPGHVRIEYALYKTILCCFYQTLSHDRDQSKTQETLQLANQLLGRKEVLKTYTAEVQNIQHECYQKQFKSDLCIVQDYITRGKITSGEHRLRIIKEQYKDVLQLSLVEPEVLYLESIIAHHKHNEADATHKLEELSTKFPEHRYALNMRKKRDLMQRF